MLWRSGRDLAFCGLFQTILVRSFFRRDRLHLGDARLALVVHALNFCLKLLIEKHDRAIDKVGEEKDNGFPQFDLPSPYQITIVHLCNFAIRKNREQAESEDVEGTIPEERPPSQLDWFFGRHSARANNSKHVKDGRAYDTAKTYITSIQADGTNEGGEQFWRRPTGCHESGTGNIRLDV